MWIACFWLLKPAHLMGSSCGLARPWNPCSPLPLQLLFGRVNLPVSACHLSVISQNACTLFWQWHLNSLNLHSQYPIKIIHYPWKQRSRASKKKEKTDEITNVHINYPGNGDGGCLLLNGQPCSVMSLLTLPLSPPKWVTVHSLFDE